MIRVGIIGCGKVADKHASQIQRVPGSLIVGVCDREELMARQLAERMEVENYFYDAERMLSACHPDVVHITTPPQSHYDLARQCLEAGCHVYIEKPFTVTSQEARQLISLAEATGKKLTVGNETQFMPVSIDMRKLIQSGYLGGPPVHMESTYCYDFSDERYAKALLGDPNHWIRQLPGGLLQNIISHGIGKIVEYLQDEQVTVVAKGFTSNFLEKIGESDIHDELRVIITDNHRTTAYFTFSSQIAPPLHQFRVYGPKNSLIADHDHQTLLRVPGRTYKSFLNQFIPPFLEGKQNISNGLHNINQFLYKKTHSESGMYNLISAFYHCIAENTFLPIPYRDILLTISILDEIFSQLIS